jgi:hypothetical protein
LRYTAEQAVAHLQLCPQYTGRSHGRGTAC